MVTDVADVTDVTDVGDAIDVGVEGSEGDPGESADVLLKPRPGPSTATMTTTPRAMTTAATATIRRDGLPNRSHHPTRSFLPIRRWPRASRSRVSSAIYHGMTRQHSFITPDARESDREPRGDRCPRDEWK